MRLIFCGWKWSAVKEVSWVRTCTLTPTLSRRERGIEDLSQKKVWLYAPYFLPYVLMIFTLSETGKKYSAMCANGKGLRFSYYVFRNSGSTKWQFVQGSSRSESLLRIELPWSFGSTFSIKGKGGGRVTESCKEEFSITKRMTGHSRLRAFRPFPLPLPWREGELEDLSPEKGKIVGALFFGG